MPLVTRSAEPLTEDPFSDPNAAGEVPDFPAQRYIDAGATEDELIRLATYYDEGTARQRRDAARWIEAASDADFTEALTLWRQFVADAEAEAALTAGTVDEVLDRVRSAPDEERLDLARRTLTAEQSKEGDDVRTTLTEPLERLIADAEEALAAEEAAAAERTRLTEGSVDDVLARVGEDKEVAQATLDAERALRGDDARKTLVAGLEKVLAAEPPPAPEGTQTAPDGTAPAADGQPGPAAEGSPATP